MPNKSGYPRLFTHVLQAVAEMREAKGSTVKKIVEQVNSSIHISNIRPKPRNVVLQVRKAIQHGVDAGVLRQRAGKVFLTLRNDPPPQRRNAAKSVRLSSRSQRRLARNKNRKLMENAKESPLKSYKMPPVKKAAARKGRKKKRSGKKRKRSVRRRAVTPVKKPSVGLNGDDENEAKSDRSRRTSYNCLELPQDQIEEVIKQIDNDIEEPSNHCTRNSATCDNPECICNIKQEPVDQDDQD